MAERKPWSNTRVGHNKIYSVGIDMNAKEEVPDVDLTQKEAVDEFPEGETEESLKEENPTLVYCAFVDCIWNKPITGLKKFMTASKNPLSKSYAFEDDAFKGVCGRGVIAIIKKSKISASNVKTETPECFTMGKDGRASDHLDFTKLMPQGGTIPEPAGRGYV